MNDISHTKLIIQIQRTEYIRARLSSSFISLAALCFLIAVAIISISILTNIKSPLALAIGTRFADGIDFVRLGVVVVECLAVGTD